MCSSAPPPKPPQREHTSDIVCHHVAQKIVVEVLCLLLTVCNIDFDMHLILLPELLKL